MSVNLDGRHFLGQWRDNIDGPDEPPVLLLQFGVLEDWVYVLWRNGQEIPPVDPSQAQPITAH